MKFSEVAAQTIDWLQRDGRVSYRALKREFDLDDEFIEALKAELIDAERIAIDEERLSAAVDAGGDQYRRSRTALDP